MNNPFATRFTRPGAIDFRLEGESTEQIVTRIISLWKTHESIGQIVGPHGTGKTTLLHSVARHVLNQGNTVRFIQLQKHRNRKFFHPRVRYLIHEHSRDNMAKQPDVLIIDGFEQLGWLGKLATISFVRQRKIALMMTAHRSCPGIPLLTKTHANEAHFQSLVYELLRNFPNDMQWVSALDAHQTYKNNNGNAREAFFDLFDLYQERSKQRNAEPEKQLCT